MSNYYQPTQQDLEAQRPGCQQFLDIPSLRNGERVPYSMPIPQCTGKLKDTKDHTR